jgi:pimeloyl-ACP methyl ester carboxylesterase
MKNDKPKIELDIACFGAQTGTPLLLIMGLATQRTAWPKAWIDALVERGFYVITFDNRDIGLSTRLEHLGRPKMPQLIAKRLLGLSATPPYSLQDMAQDTLQLLDRLKIASAHVFGVSMGGMIAQWLALIAPERVRSLSLMMTSSGKLGLPLPATSVFKIMTKKPIAGSSTRAAAVDYLMALFGEIGSPGYPVPQLERRARALAQVDRSMAGIGALRQLAAILADGVRWRKLGAISQRTQILHGDADKMVPLAHGRDLAKRIPGATLEIFPGLGHDLPEALAGTMATRIARLAGL